MFDQIAYPRMTTTELYDKTDDFNIPIVNFPFICTELMVFICEIEVITSKVLRSPPWIDLYGISVLQITTDMFHLSWALLGPFLMSKLSPGV
jgi:hypothetical protein